MSSGVMQCVQISFLTDVSSNHVIVTNSFDSVESIINSALNSGASASSRFDSFDEEDGRHIDVFIPRHFFTDRIITLKRIEVSTDRYDKENYDA